MTLFKRIALTLAVCFAPFIVSARQGTPNEARTLRGIVAEAMSGTPIPGVTVRTLSEATINQAYLGFPVPILPIIPRPDSVITSESGEFIFENLSTSRVVIESVKDGYMPEALAYAVPADQNLRVVVPLTRAGVITGVITDQRGDPAVDVVVTPLRYFKMNGQDELLRGQASFTNDRGEFRLINLRKGRYLISFVKGRRIVLEGGFNPLGPVSGGPRVSFVAEGELSVDKPTPAILYPGVTSVSDARIIEVTDAQEIRLGTTVLGTSRLGKLDVQITNNLGETAKDVSLTLTYRTPRGPGDPNFIMGPTRSIQLPAGGTTQVTYWPSLPGRFELEARWGERTLPASVSSVGGVWDGQPGVVKSFEFSGRDTLIDLPLTNSQGRLTVRGLHEQIDGTLVPLKARSAITLCPREAPCWAVEASIRGTLDATGVLTQAPVPRGTYDLASLRLPPEVYLSDARQGPRDVLTEGVDVSNVAEVVELRFRSGAATLRGVVRDSSGHPMHDALVALIPESIAFARFQGLTPTVRTDQSGEFEFLGVTPTSYRAYTWPPATDSGMPLDPDFLRDRAKTGQVVSLQENERASIALTLEGIR